MRSTRTIMLGLDQPCTLLRNPGYGRGCETLTLVLIHQPTPGAGTIIYLNARIRWNWRCGRWVLILLKRAARYLGASATAIACPISLGPFHPVLRVDAPTSGWPLLMMASRCICNGYPRDGSLRRRAAHHFSCGIHRLIYLGVINALCLRVVCSVTYLSGSCLQGAICGAGPE